MSKSNKNFTASRRKLVSGKVWKKLKAQSFLEPKLANKAFKASFEKPSSAWFYDKITHVNFDFFSAVDMEAYHEKYYASRNSKFESIKGYDQVRAKYS